MDCHTCPSAAAILIVSFDCYHNCYRYSLDGKWCVKKNKCRIGDKNLKFYIRGEWDDINKDSVQKVKWVYENSCDGDVPYYYDSENLILTGGETRCRIYS